MRYPSGVPARHYMLLDSSDPGVPLWRLVTETDRRPAVVNQAGLVGPEEFADVMTWCTRRLVVAVALRPLPSPRVYSVQEADGP